MKITIAGTGYVGLSNAILLAQHNEVIALDIIQEKVAMINNKRSPIIDNEIEEYLATKELNLTAIPGKKVSAPIVGECTLHYECKVVLKQTMDPSLLDASVKERHYKDGDFHTMFYGEIVDCYTTHSDI
mgnify:CR=1 FL=1